jgi:hypothetical protein
MQLNIAMQYIMYDNLWYKQWQSILFKTDVNQALEQVKSCRPIKRLISIWPPLISILNFVSIDIATYNSLTVLWTTRIYFKCLQINSACVISRLQSASITSRVDSTHQLNSFFLEWKLDGNSRPLLTFTELEGSLRFSSTCGIDWRPSLTTTKIFCCVRNMDV